MAQLYYGGGGGSGGGWSAFTSRRDRIRLRVVRAEPELSAQEKAYLSAVEKGDYASVKRALREAEIYFKINVNCVDPLGRTALLIAIENENLEMVELLLAHDVHVGDALLHAIRKEVVGAVELLLNHKKPSGEKQVRNSSSSHLSVCSFKLFFFSGVSFNDTVICKPLLHSQKLGY